jgi:IS30 family transposase
MAETWSGKISMTGGSPCCIRSSAITGVFAGRWHIASKLQLQFYIANAYLSRERGSLENLDGLIRLYIPKQSDSYNLTDYFIQQVQDWINSRSRIRNKYDSLSNEIKRTTRGPGGCVFC